MSVLNFLKTIYVASIQPQWTILSETGHNRLQNNQALPLAFQQLKELNISFFYLLWPSLKPTLIVWSAPPVHPILFIAFSPLLTPALSDFHTKEKLPKGNALFPIWALLHGTNSPYQQNPSSKPDYSSQPMDQTPKFFVSAASHTLPPSPILLTSLYQYMLCVCVRACVRARARARACVPMVTMNGCIIFLILCCSILSCSIVSLFLLLYIQN